MAVVDVVNPGWQVATSAPPTMPVQETAYLYFGTSNAKLFCHRARAAGRWAYRAGCLWPALPRPHPLRAGPGRCRKRHAQNPAPGRNLPGRPPRAPMRRNTPRCSMRPPPCRPCARAGFPFTPTRAHCAWRTRSKRIMNSTRSWKATAPPPGRFSPRTSTTATAWISGMRPPAEWHSLHRRLAIYTIGELTYKPPGEVEGFTQLAAGQAAPDPDNPPPDDLYLNESMARWAGWSLSAPFPGKGLSADPDPAKALEEDPDHPKNEPATPFKMTTQFTAAPKSLPSLRFGRRYRLRMRAVDHLRQQHEV